MKRRVRVRAIGFVALLAGLMLLIFGQFTADVSADGHNPSVVDVVEVSGYLDPIIADYIDRSISAAEDHGSVGMVLQVNSERALVDDDRIRELAQRIASADVPVSMWIGPSGATAAGAVGQLAGVVADLGIAPGSKLGELGTVVLPEDDLSEVFVNALPTISEQYIDWEQAVAAGLSREAPTLPFFVLELPGFESNIDTSGDEPVRVPVSSVRFAKLPLVDQFMHTAASPALAYLLFLIGAGLLVFEFYTAGVGIIGVVGALCLLFGCYGLAALPVRTWAIALLVVAFFGFAVDIQVGVPRVWTGIAIVCLVAGSFMLFEGLLISWITLLVGIIGTFAGMVAGMPAMVRTRFSTPTIGRDWMIGAEGSAREAVDPEGVVEIDGAPWRARTHRATPVDAGGTVRVVALEGLVLTVEPASDAGDEG